MPSACDRRRSSSSADAGVHPADIDWFVPHQANQRILDAAAKKLGIAPRKSDLDRGPARQYVGGLGASGAGAAVRDGRIKQGDLVMLEAMGGGFTWGAALIRW